MRKIYYKVVTPLLQSACSAFRSLQFRNMAIQYKINEFVRSEYAMPLYVFDNFLDAKTFAINQSYHSHCDLLIYRAYITSKCRKTLIQNGGDLHQLKKIYTNKKSISTLSGQYKSFVPHGTIAAKAIKIFGHSLYYDNS